MTEPNTKNALEEIVSNVWFHGKPIQDPEDNWGWVALYIANGCSADRIQEFGKDCILAFKQALRTEVLKLKEKYKAQGFYTNEYDDVLNLLEVK